MTDDILKAKTRLQRATSNISQRLIASMTIVYGLFIIVVMTQYLFTVNAENRLRKFENAARQFAIDEAARFEKMNFTDIIEYHAIHPEHAESVVGDEAVFCSDRTIHDLVKDVPVTIIWQENIVIDRSPDDEVYFYNHYAKVETTERYLTKPSPRKNLVKGEPCEGYVSNAYATGKPIIYNRPGRYRMTSKMTIKMPYGVVKNFDMRSYPTLVKRRTQNAQ